MLHSLQTHTVRGTLFTVFLIASCAMAAAQPTFQVLYSFTDQSDGVAPVGGLAIGADGVLYGTTAGGSHGPALDGTIFSLTPPASPSGTWTLATLVDLENEPGLDSHPKNKMVLGKGGILYCATTGPGVAFALTPPASGGSSWTPAPLYDFGYATGYPPSDLVLGSHGELYGTTPTTAFVLKPPAVSGGSWTERTLHVFTGTPEDGSAPSGGVVIGEGGVLYGATSSGGLYNEGTVYSLAPPAAQSDRWIETILYNFPAGTGAVSPRATLTIGARGVLYGVTSGTAFSLTPPASPGAAWTEAVIYTFSSDEESPPSAGLAIGNGGVLYGVNAGDGFGGTVFSLTPPTSPGGVWTFTALYSMEGSTGRLPQAPLAIGKDGVLYGTAPSGGIYEPPYGLGCGIVFSITP